MAAGATHDEILEAIKHLDAKIGSEKIDHDTGKVTATGLFARVHAVERKDQADEMNRLRWKNRILGVTAAAGLCGAIVMYLAGDRVDGIRDTIRSPPTVEAKK